MFLMGEFLFSAVSYLFGAFLPFIIIALIISLIVRNSKGKKTAYGYVKPGEVLMEGADTNANAVSHGNMAAPNILLYVGSFLIVGSVLLFIKDEPSVVPFVTFFITIITFVIGLLLYRYVEYLRPVATAFTYTAMILFPLWYYAFTELGLSDEVALFISTAVSLGAYIGGAASIDSRIAGWLSYIWLLFFGWTGANMIDANSSSHSLLTYSFFVWPFIVAIFSTICWSFRVKWLPVAFRKATKVLAEWLAPIFAVFACTLFVAPNVGSEYPALRIIALSFAVVNGLIGWLMNRKNHVAILALRIYVQALIMAIFADVANYSIGAKNTIEVEVIAAIIWLISFLGQTICSLFIPQQTEKDKSIEKTALVLSLFGIFSTWGICLNFDPTPRAIVYIAISAVIAALGALIGWRYKNITWAIATVLGIMVIPIIIVSELLPAGDYSYLIYGIYTVLTLIFIGIYLLLHNAKVQPERSLGVAAVAVIAGSALCVGAMINTDWSPLGWLAAAIFSALISIIPKKYALLECSSYLAAFAAAAFASKIYSASKSYSLESILAFSAVQMHILTLPLIIVGFIKERGKKNCLRKILGVISLLLSMFIIASLMNSIKSYTLPILFIFEAVIFIIIGAFMKHKWMAIVPSILVTILVFEPAGVFSGIWLMLIGITLIAIVAWQLTKNAKKQ